MKAMMEPTVPYPPRFRWLMRLSIATMLLAIMLTGIRMWWGHIAHARLQAEVDRIRAAGEPILIEDVQTPGIPDERNAAHYLRQAIAAWDLTHENDDERYLADNSAAIALVRQARQHPDADWNIQIASPMYMILLPHLSQTRQLARWLEDAAHRHMRLGNHREALQLVEDQFTIAHTLDAQPLLLNHLVGMSIRLLAIDTVRQILPRVIVVDNDDQAENTATREQIERLIDVLIDDDLIRTGIANSLNFERVYVYDMNMLAADGELGLVSFVLGSSLPIEAERWFVHLVGPVFQLDAVHMMREIQAVTDVVHEEDTLPAATRRLKHVMDMELPYTRPLSKISMWGLEGLVRSHYQQVVQMRLTAVMLAIKLYELDHGRRPDALDVLVPRYLDALPIDPLRHDGGVLGYKPHGVDPFLPWAESALYGSPEDHRLGRRVPILYSVGVDGIDDGGAVLLNDDGLPHFRHDAGNDLVVLLDGPVTLPPRPDWSATPDSDW